MGSLDYASGSDHPLLIGLCERCNMPECDGICALYKDLWREIYRKPPCHKQGSRKGRKTIGKYKQPLEAFGETHHLAMWARMYDIPYRTLYQRICREHHTLEESLKMGRRANQHYREPVRYSYGGKTLSIREWSEYTGICQETIRARIERGWSVEDAVTTLGNGKKIRL